ncbi:MAG: hypothetical protein IT334_11720 [Thermomicrobiales bacterium]|nr:hypothetical protein [Thermomicrobiales bacterium]
MRFARVTGHVLADEDTLMLTVVLDAINRIETVRSERVPALGDAARRADLAWQADQYTQETIGNELALAGWEVVSEEPSAPAPPGTGVSQAYLVRNIGGGS